MTAVRLRQGCRYALLLAALLGAPSCQWADDTGAAKASFAVIRQQIDDVSARISSAVQNGEADRIPALDRDMNAALDAARNQSSAMNLLDREHLNINVATAKQCLSGMDRYAQSGDNDLLRAQAAQLAPTVSEIRVLLDRADRIANSK